MARSLSLKILSDKPRGICIDANKGGTRSSSVLLPLLLRNKARSKIVRAAVPVWHNPNSCNNNGSSRNFLLVLVAEDAANFAAPAVASSSVSVLVVTAQSAIPLDWDVPIRLGFLLLVAVLLVAVVVDPLLFVVLKLCQTAVVSVTENPATPILGCDAEGSGSNAHNNTSPARPSTMVVWTTEDAERSEEEEGRFRTIMIDNYEDENKIEAIPVAVVNVYTMFAYK